MVESDAQTSCDHIARENLCLVITHIEVAPPCPRQGRMAPDSGLIHAGAGPERGLRVEASLRRAPVPLRAPGTAD